jgi:hypothetical protein
MAKAQAVRSQPQASAPAERPKPVFEVRFGRIRASVWKNHHPDQGDWFSVQITRLYKDDKGWKAATSFGRDDLLVVAKVADKAHDWICAQQQASQVAAREDGAPDESAPY